MTSAGSFFLRAMGLICLSIWSSQAVAIIANPIPKQLLLQAIELGADLTPPGTQFDLYGAIAQEFAAMGEVSDATRLAVYFDVKRGKDKVLLAAVRGSLRNGHEDQAIDLTKLMTDEFEKGWALTDIARFQAERSEFSRLQETIADLSLNPLAEYALMEVVPSMVKAGLTQDAIQAALHLEFDHSKGQVISSIVETQYSLGDVDVARETATTYSQTLNNQWPILALSRAEADAGNFQAAYNTASQLKQQLGFFASAHIAEALAKYGDISKAIDLAKTIPFPIDRHEDGPTTRFRAIGNIAITQAQQGDYDGAFTTAQIIPKKISACDICGYWIDEVISEIGKAEAKRGDLDLALRTAEKLKKSTAYYGDEVTESVVLAHIRKMQIEAALKTSKRFRSHEYKARTYQELARYWVKKDGPDVVMKWASRLRSNLEKAYTLVGVARGITDS